MQIFKLKRNKKKKAFTFIEIIVALGILSIIAFFIFPSLTSLLKNFHTNKNDARIIFAMEEAIEMSKDEDLGDFSYQVDDIEVFVSISDYEDNPSYKDISAKYGNKVLRLVVEK